MNSLRNKIIGLRDFVVKVPADISCIDKPKLDD